MFFWWGNFHFLNTEWFIGFPQHCCLAFNNLQIQQRKREWHLHFQVSTQTDSSVSTCEAPAHICGEEGETTGKKTPNRTTKSQHQSVSLFFPPPRYWLTLLIFLSHQVFSCMCSSLLGIPYPLSLLIPGSQTGFLPASSVLVYSKAVGPLCPHYCCSSLELFKDTTLGL